MAASKLETVRENPRVAAFVGAVLGASVAVASMGVALMFGAQPAARIFGMGLSDVTGTGSLVALGVAAALGALIGAVQSTMLYFHLRRHAAHCTPLPVVARIATLNAGLSSGFVALVGAVVLMAGPREWLYDAIAVAVAVFATMISVALLSLSHAADWPSVPDYALRGVKPRSSSPFADDIEGNTADRHSDNTRVIDLRDNGGYGAASVTPRSRQANIGPSASRRARITVPTQNRPSGAQ